MSSRAIGAFFDFDKTLIEKDSPSLGIRYLWERKIISLLYILKVMLICTDLEVGPNGILTGRTIGPICSEDLKRELAI